MGYFATSAEDAVPPHKSYFPTFARALNLARDLGVPATTETLKTLESAEISKAMKRPNKRPRKLVGTTQGQEIVFTGKGKAPLIPRPDRDDVVSLGYTEQDEEMEFEEGEGHMTDRKSVV